MLEFVIKYWIEALFALIIGALSAGFRYLWKKRKEDEIEQKAIKTGMIAILHDRLFQACNYHLSLGYIPLNRAEETLDNLKIMYSAYHDLGGNGTGTKIYNRVVELPIKNEGE